MAIERDFITPAGLSVLTTANVVGNTTFIDIYANTARAQSYPTFSQNFARSPYIDSRFSFVRFSNATYVAANGLIAYANTQSPRFEYDPLNGECKGLLLEDQRTNLILKSIDMNAPGYWASYDGDAGGDNQAVQSNAAIAPDGSNTAVFYYHRTGVSTYYSFYQFVTVTTGVSYTYSVFFKANTSSYTYPYVRLYHYDNTDGNNSLQCFYDTAANSVSGLIYSANVVIQSGPYVQDYQDGWKRMYYTFRYTSGSSHQVQLKHDLDGGYAAAGRGYYLWGPQLEAGTSISSYIPTDTTTMTRAWDFCWANNISSFLNGQANVTVVAKAATYCYNGNTINNEYRFPAQWSLETMGHPLRNQAADRVSVFFAPAAGQRSIGTYWRSANLYSSNTDISYGQYGTAAVSYTIGENQYISNAQYITTALVCQTNNWIYVANGNIAVNQTANQGYWSANTNRMMIGGGDSVLHGYIKTIAVYPRVLSNSELVAITTS